MKVLVLILILIQNINSQSIYGDIRNNDHIEFISTYSSLFYSNIKKKYNDYNDIIIEHERLLSSIVKNQSLSSSQRPYVLNLKQDCGSVCHHKISLYLARITSLSTSTSLLLSKRSDLNDRYNIINVDKALLSTSLNNINKIIEKYPYYIRGYTPLLSINKIDIDTYDNTKCEFKPNEYNITFSIIIVIAPLELHDLNSFITKMKQFQNESTVLFEFEYDGVEPNIKSNGLVSFYDCEPIDDVLHSLSEFNEILWIERAPQLEFFNRWTRSVCQTAVVDNTPLYNTAQLTGLNVVIGIADTGIDMTHCHFYDPDYPTPINTINPKHRKIVTYAYTTSGAPKTDVVDLGFDGHGTHVAG